VTQAKAQTVASALIAAGYEVSVKKQVDNTYILTVTGNEIVAQTVATFAANQSVTATVNTVTLV
jgi:hypothetical protein